MDFVEPQRSRAEYLDRILPQHKSERMAFLFTLAGVPIVAIYELFFVYPATPQAQSSTGTGGFAQYCLVILFIAHNIYCNLWLILTTDASGRSSKLPHVLKPHWAYCYVCKLNAPPRAYHCSICNECILKRDHHSLFTGTMRN